MISELDMSRTCSPIECGSPGPAMDPPRVDGSVNPGLETSILGATPRRLLRLPIVVLLARVDDGDAIPAQERRVEWSLDVLVDPGWAPQLATRSPGLGSPVSTCDPSVTVLASRRPGALAGGAVESADPCVALWEPGSLGSAPLGSGGAFHDSFAQAPLEGQAERRVEQRGPSVGGGPVARVW